MNTSMLTEYEEQSPPVCTIAHNLALPLDRDAKAQMQLFPSTKMQKITIY